MLAFSSFTLSLSLLSFLGQASAFALNQGELVLDNHAVKLSSPTQNLKKKATKTKTKTTAHHTTTTKPKAKPTVASTIDRVFIIIFENENADTVMQDSYFGTTLVNEGRLLSDMHAIAHPSQPNYIALITGDTNGISSDSSKTIDVQSIVDLLEAKGISWKSYQESYAGDCSTATTSGTYARKHNPFISIKNIQTDATRCALIASSDDLATDVANNAVPQFVFYTPDLNNDGHDTDVATASGFLQPLLDPLLKNANFKNTVFVITYDENDAKDDTTNNQIYTVLVGGPVPKGTTDSTAYDHYSTLAFVEKTFNLGNLGANDASAIPFSW